MSYSPTSLKILNNIKLIAFFNFFSEFLLYSPIAVIYFSKETGSFTLGMSIFSIVTITQTLCEMPMGFISDSIGRRKTMIFGSSLMIFSLLFYISGFGYSALLMGAICEGMGKTFFSGNNSALLYETLKQAGRENDFSMISGKTDSMFQLALSISALLGSFLAIYFPLSTLFLLTLFPYSMALVISIFIVEPQIHSNQDQVVNNALIHIFNSFADCYKNRKLKLLLTSESLSLGIGEAIHHFRPAFIAICWPIWAVGIHRTLAHALGFIGYRLAGKLIKRFSASKLLFVSSSIISLINFTGLFLANLLSPILMAIPSMTYGFERTSMKTLQQNQFLDNQRATMGSISGMLSGLIYAVMMILLGWFADNFGVIKALFFALVCMLSVLFINYKLYRDYK
jgi:MFS family permease